MTPEKLPSRGSSTRFQVKPGTTSKAAPRREPGRFDVEARRIVRAEMQRRDVSYKELVKRMNAMAEPDERVTERSLISRINRGTFTFGFTLHVLRAMGVTKLGIGEIE